MRILRLVEAAVQAERLRLTAQAHRTMMRVAWAAVALVFGAGALACIHVAAVSQLAEAIGLIKASLAIATIDLVIAAILVVLALRNQPGATEQSALALRREVWVGIQRDLALVNIATTVFNMFRKSK